MFKKAFVSILNPRCSELRALFSFIEFEMQCKDPVLDRAIMPCSHQPEVRPMLKD